MDEAAGSTRTDQPGSGTGLRHRRLAALLVSVLGGLALAAGMTLAAVTLWQNANAQKAAGQIIDIAVVDGARGPVVAFVDAQGVRHTFAVPPVAGGNSLRTGDNVSVFYETNDPAHARIADYTGDFMIPALVASAGALALMIGALLMPLVAQAPVEPEREASRLQFHPFNAVAVQHYLNGLGAPQAQRKVKVTDAALALVDGRIPVALAEFLAYALALTYHDRAAELAAQINPRLERVRLIESGRHRALAFLFEGLAVIAIVDTQAGAPGGQWAARLGGRVKARDLLPPGSAWDAVPRRRVYAQSWDAMRESVEAWIKDITAPAGDVPPRFLLTGHASGGALAMLAAYEYAKRARAIAGVVTFGASSPGGRAFARDYRELDLDVRTLDVRAATPALRLPAFANLRKLPGAQWVLLPPDANFLTPSRIPRRGQPITARLVHHLLDGEDRHGAQAARSLWRSLALASLAFDKPAARAIVRHDIERRYALRLTGMVAGRLRTLLTAPDAAQPSSAEVARALSDHLIDIRGVRPEDAAQAFAVLDGLPALPP